LCRKVELSWTTISEALEWKWAAVLYMVEVFYFAFVHDWWGFFFFQVRAVLAVKMRTLRMIQIHGTMHIGVNTALLQVSYWHCGIFYQSIQRELNNFATPLANV
jgi:hypothetical protein